MSEQETEKRDWVIGQTDGQFLRRAPLGFTASIVDALRITEAEAREVSTTVPGVAVRPASDFMPEERVLTFQYRNWRGQVSMRRAFPERIWFGTTAWHDEPQWFLHAFDFAKNAARDFALRDMVMARGIGMQAALQEIRNCFTDEEVPFGCFTYNTNDLRKIINICDAWLVADPEPDAASRGYGWARRRFSWRRPVSNRGRCVGSTAPRLRTMSACHPASLTKWWPMG